MRRFILLAAAMLMTSASAASAATISFTAPSVVSGTFDVVVQAENVFGGRDELTDAVIGYGFDVAVSNPLVLSFLGATSGPLFDPPPPERGTDVFGAASGFAIFPPVSEPPLLATLHFKTTGTGPSS